MRTRWDLHALAVCAVVRLGYCLSSSREYAPGTWATTFFRPREVLIEAVGIINQDVVFFQTRWGVSALHDGFLTPVIEVDKEVEHITAFHLCHHRNSIFYEALSRDGGLLSIFEYSLSSRHKEKVREFQDAVEATALACVDQLLLRASPAGLLALHLQTGSDSVLVKANASEQDDVITSLAVRYEADVISQAEIFAIVPHNTTVLRLHVAADGGSLVAHSEPLLSGGDGSDGPLDAASLQKPTHVLASRSKVLVVDGCSLREIHDQHVRTLLGAPDLCCDPANETVEPAPWASKLSRLTAAAPSAASTSVDTMLVVTERQVIKVLQRGDACHQHSAEADCVQQPGCGWAEGAEHGHHSCFECAGLEAWADRQVPPIEACSLEMENRADTRYSLTGCGCTAPPAPSPVPVPGPASDEEVRSTVQAVLAVFLVLAAALASILLYRGYRRAAVMRELYGVDTAEFHTFAEEECYH